MRSALTAERVRRDVEVLARAGLDIETFLSEMMTSVQRALPAAGACVATLDPATQLLTGTYKFGDLYGKDERDADWGLIEYGETEPDSFVELAQRRMPVASVRLERGDVHQSMRMRDFMAPVFGYHDELRVLGRDDHAAWGGIALFRGHDMEPFDEGDVAFAASLSTAFAHGLRAGLLVRLAHNADEVDGDAFSGPAVLIVDRNDRLSQVSVGAEARLRAMAAGTHTADAIGVVSSLVARARRYAAGLTDGLPRCRVRLRTGHWLVLHGSPLSGPQGPSGDVVVTIEEARPPEIIPLVVSAFELTPREQEVTGLVLQGVDTKEIAKTLHMSAYTVQDHLKSIFEKADVRSRRELIARVFFDQYLPRLGQEIGPGGWFAGS